MQIRKFIELTCLRGVKFLLNVDDVHAIFPQSNSEGSKILFKRVDFKSLSSDCEFYNYEVMYVQESYDEIKKEIEDAV